MTDAARSLAYRILGALVGNEPDSRERAIKYAESLVAELSPERSRSTAGRLPLPERSATSSDEVTQ